MKYCLMLGVIAVCAMASVRAEVAAEQRIPEGTLTPRPHGPEWQDLLTVENAAEWRSNIKTADVFEIRDGTLHVFGKESGAHIGYMKERLRDFQLHVEFKTSPKANSGILLRGEQDDPLFTGIEIQVFEDYGGHPTRFSCGALYGVATPMFNPSKPAGEWNSFDITCHERTLIVVFNGWKILDVDLARLTMPLGRLPKPYAQLSLDGYLFVQDNVGDVWYRNIVLKKLES